VNCKEVFQVAYLGSSIFGSLLTRINGGIGPKVALSLRFPIKGSMYLRTRTVERLLLLMFNILLAVDIHS
jgi:hypothetical protein